MTNVGHLLAFPVGELPELDKGKGNKLIDIPKAKLGTERVVAVAVVAPGATLTVKSGSRTMSLSFKDLDAYVGARASRGGSVAAGLAEGGRPRCPVTPSPRALRRVRHPRCQRLRGRGRRWKASMSSNSFSPRAAARSPSSLPQAAGARQKVEGVAVE